MCGQNKTKSLSRRHVVAGVGAAFVASVLNPARSGAAEDEPSAPSAIPPREALERLKEGNARYVAGNPKNSDFSAKRVAEASSRYPIAAILSSSDSPVPPEIIFDQAPGDLFVVRNAGNVVSTYSLASMEYAVQFLSVPLVFVLGHSGCGVVAMALGATRMRKQMPGHLQDIVKSIEPAVITAHGRHPGDFLAASVEEDVRLGVKRLKTKSEIIGKAVNTGGLEIKGGFHDLETGAVTLI